MKKSKRDRVPGEPLRDQDLETVTGGMRPIAEESSIFSVITPEDAHSPEHGGKSPVNNRFF